MKAHHGYFDPNVEQHKQKKLIKVIIGLLITLVIGLAIMALIGSEPKPTQKLGVVLARHNELVRVLDEYSTNPRSNDASILMASSRVILASDATELASLGTSVAPEQEAEAIYAGIDADLEQAIRNNLFDETIANYIFEMLAQNKVILDGVIEQTSKDDVRAVAEQILINYQELQ